MKTERTNMGGDRNNKGWRAQQRQEELRKTERTNGRGGGGGDRNNMGRRAQQEQEELVKTERTNKGETETIRGGGPNKRQEELVKTERTSRGGEASKFRGQGKNKGEGDH